MTCRHHETDLVCNDCSDSPSGGPPAEFMQRAIDNFAADPGKVQQLIQAIRAAYLKETK